MTMWPASAIPLAIPKGQGKFLGLVNDKTYIFIAENTNWDDSECSSKV